MNPFKEGLRYLSEGGQETELMYGHGFDLPQFALFPLLDDPAAVATLKGMYEQLLGVAARRGMAVLLGGLDYRASPDWADLLGYDKPSLREHQERAIDFLREVSAPFRNSIPDILICGIVGPQGDAYERNETITVASAEAYHSIQLANLASAGVDVVQAMTLTNADEAIGIARAAEAFNLPVVISFMPDLAAYARGSPPLEEMIRQVDETTGGYPLFYGLNCSHPREFGSLFDHDSRWASRIGLLRPNASSKEKVALCQIGHLERGDPHELAELMSELAVQLPQVKVWGGCCGTWAEHLDLIAAKLPRPGGQPPP
jgi:S-methylmethionine-dependent homocysteine/selenocysteine methylase